MQNRSAQVVGRIGPLLRSSEYHSALAIIRNRHHLGRGHALTEIPEHLLKRSKERKAALSGDAPAEDAAGTTETAAVTPAADAAPVAASAALPDVAPEPEPPARIPPYVEKANTRKKVPYWIAPVLLALPVWAIMYVGTLERVPQGLTGLLGEGEELYVESGCSGCHGLEGGGGIGPALDDGEVHVSFTSIEDQIVWIAKGSSGVGTGNTYTSEDSTRPRAVRAQMPGFAPENGNAAVRLTPEEILAVTLFERTQFEPGDEAERDLAIAASLTELIETGELELPESYDAATINSDEVLEWIEPAVAELTEEEG